MPEPAARIGDPISCGDTIAQGSGNVFINGIPATRKGDMTAGHGCHEPVEILDGSGVVYVNNIPFARVTEKINKHECDDDEHDGTIDVGSPDVFVGGTGAAAAVAVVGEAAPPASAPLEDHLDFRYTISCDGEQDGDVNAYVSYMNTQSPDPNRPSNPDDEMEDESDRDTPAPPPETIPVDCEDIYSHEGDFPGSFKLSENFTIAMLSTNTLVSNYKVRAQAGVSIKDIVCNMRQLCVNVLEPMRAKYGSAMRINSGFRHGSGRSQHYRGQAVDISFTDVSGTEGNYKRAVDIRDTFSYDQFIFEQNNSIWFHVSYNPNGNRRMVLSKPRGNKFYPGLRKIKV